MKRAFLFILLLMTACSPATVNETQVTPHVDSSVTRPAPVVAQSAGPTPSGATLTAVAVLSEEDDESDPATEQPQPTVTDTPTATPTPEPSPTSLGPQEINGIPLSDLVPMPPETAANVAAIYARGQELGRDSKAFSKLGDSTILNPHFLGPFDEGTYNLSDFGYLQPTIDRWRGSFKRHGVGAHFGLHSWTVFDPMWADEKWCEPGEHLLACELRLQNPSVLFVRLGSNDSGSPSGFRYNVRDVIKYAIEHGVIPIIGTKADRFEGSNENNEILRELTAEYHVPLWDFDLLAETLPNRGLGTDNIHLAIEDLPHDYTLPETFQRGHPMQDLTALIALDQVRRIIEETN